MITIHTNSKDMYVETFCQHFYLSGTYMYKSRLNQGHT